MVPAIELVNNGRLRFAPVIELVGWHVLGGQQQNAGTLGLAEGTNIVNLKFGARTTFDEVSSFYVGYGHSLTDASGTATSSESSTNTRFNVEPRETEGL